MKRPDITPGTWNARTTGSNGIVAIEPVIGYTTPMSPYSDANARAIAALPDVLAALEGLLKDKYLADPINADRMKPAREALTKAGYTF